MTAFLDVSFLHWSLIALVLCFGCLLQTSVGFGMALISAPIVVLLQPTWVPIILMLVAVPLTLTNWHEQRHFVQMKMMLVPMISRLPGLALGVWFLVWVEPSLLQMVVAVCVLLAVLISWLGKSFQPTPLRLAVAGFVSGFTASTTAIGGPPMVLVMQHSEPAIMRANLSVFFALGCILSCIGYAFSGLLTWQLCLIGVSYVPFVFLGNKLGRRLRKYIPVQQFRPMILILCSAAGVVALASALPAFLENANI